MPLPETELDELPGPFDGSLSLWQCQYDSFHASSSIGSLIREMKQQDSESIRALFIQAIVDYFIEHPQEIPPDIVTVIPDSRRRSFQTVSAVASGFCKELSWTFREGLIIPAKVGKPQKNRSWAERQGDRTSRYRPADPEIVSGKHILIFDDIFATGQSMTEAAKLFRDAGAESVSALVLVRLLRP